MTRADSPLTYLAALPVRQRPKIRVNFADYAFLTGAFVVIAGGCLSLLDMASARSSGQESMVLRFLSDSSTWLPAVMAHLGKYALLLLASILNSAFIVALVFGLRTLDRKVGTVRQNWPCDARRVSLHLSERGKAKNVRGRTTRVLSRESSFLLSPVFR